ncbi:MAG: YbaB/EbfC family nucleoid-associated protein [Acidobacteriaceae bacterium]
MDLGKLQGMMAQARQMKEDMDRKLAETVVEASAGGGMVTVTMNGQKQLLKLKIDPAVVSGSSPLQELEMIEDLVTAAINEASRKADEASKSAMQGMMGGMLGGMNIPGLF